jgi:hypothetical protein
VIAWRTGPAQLGGGVAAMTRAAGGTFGRPETVARSRVSESSGNTIAVVFGGGAPPVDTDADRLRIALGPGNRALLAWTGSRGPGRTATARAATGVLGGAFDEPQAVSAPLREAEAPAPLFLADGRAAVAWVDNATLSLTPAFRTRGEHDGRLHLAVEGASAPASRAPRLRLRAERVQHLFPSQPVHVTARCDRPCDLLGRVRGADPVATTLPVAGSAELELPRSSIFEVEESRSGRLRVDVSAAEPGGRTAARASVRVRVVRRPPLPLRRPLDVRARRRGDAIVVRWRTARPARRMYFSVFGHRSRRIRGVDTSATGFARGRGRTSFVARLRPDRPRRVRWVTVFAASLDRQRSRSGVVRVG